MRLGLIHLGRGSGTDHFIYAHARVLAEISDLTCYLSVESTLLDLFEQLPCKVRAIRWNRGYKNLVKAILSNQDTSGVSQIILQDNPDLVVDTHVSWWSSVLHSKLAGKIPVAGVIHDVTPHPGLTGLLSTIYGVILPLKADPVIALSDYTYRELAKKYPHKSCISSRHGIFHLNANANPLEIASMRNKTLFLGRIDSYKGIDVLVDAFGIAKQTNPDLELDIVGKGKISEHTVKKIAELGIGRNAAYVPDEELKQIVRSHGIMVLPYTSATQSGVAAIALGNGLPTVATSVGALPEQVIDGRNGIIVPPNDPVALSKAILEIAADGEMARRMSEAALQIGREDYSWEQISRRLLDDLTDFLARNKHKFSG